MSTEQQPTPATNAPHPTHAPTEAKAEPNALASALTGGWEKFKQGQLLSYPMMALLLLIVTGIGVTWWIMHERTKTRSALWVELDGLTTPAALKEFAEKNPTTAQGKLANLELARVQLGPEGIDRMTALDPAARKAAVASVEQARESFAKLVDEFKDDPVIKVECMLACAKAEAVLVGYPKEGQVANPLDPKPLESRGDPKKAIEWLNKVAEAAPDTDWGKDAKKLAETLQNQNTEQQVRTLQSMVYDLSPALPKFDPKAPNFPGLGGPGGPPPDFPFGP
jgi:hypothetical protein